MICRFAARESDEPCYDLACLHGPPLFKNMRVPRSSIVYRAYETGARLSGYDNGKDWTTSTGEHLPDIRSYANHHDYQVVREFIDVETTKHMGRTHFTEMIRFLEEHPDVRIILCEKTDRLYRNFKDHVPIDALDLTLIFVKEGSVFSRKSRSHEKFIHGIKVLMAKNYIDDVSEKTRKGMLEKAEEGEFPGTAPLGYWNNKANKTIEIGKERAPLIRQLFEQYASGTYSLRGLEMFAAKTNIPTRRGSRVSRSSIATILKNPFYTGVFLWSGKQYQGKHEPIIDDELFKRAQAVSNQRNDTRAIFHRFTYSGLLKCAHCGSTVTAEMKKEQYIYYHCTFDKGACGGAHFREEELERQFEAILSELHFSDEIFEWMRDALRQSAQEKTAFHDHAIEVLNARYAKLQNRIDQIYLDKLDGEIEEAFYRKNVTARRSEQTEILDNIARHQKADENYIEQGIELHEIAKNSAEFCRTQISAQKTELLRFIMPGSKLEHDTVVPDFSPPFDMIHQMAQEARDAALSDDRAPVKAKKKEGDSLWGIALSDHAPPVGPSANDGALHLIEDMIPLPGNLLVRSRSYLRRLFEVQRLSAREIARRLKVSHPTVLAALASAGLSVQSDDVNGSRRNGHRSVKGQIPFGFVAMENRLVKCEEEQTVIRLVRQLRSTDLSLRKIAAELNCRLIPTKNHGLWQANTVKKILDRVDTGTQASRRSSA